MAQANTGTYSFDNVIVLIKHPKYDSTISITGFMRDSSITASRPDKRWTSNPSGDGRSTTMVKNPIRAGMIEFTLNQSTPSITVLNEIIQHADNAEEADEFLFEITVVEKSSGSFHSGFDCVVSEPESVEYGLEENGRQYSVDCGLLLNGLKGAAKLSKSDANIVRALGGTVDDSRVASY